MTNEQNPRMDLTVTPNESGEQVRIHGRVVTQADFDAGLSIRTDGGGWNGTRVVTTEFLIQDVTGDDGPVNAIILLEVENSLGRRHAPHAMFIETTVTGAENGHLLLEGGTRLDIEQDVYGISI